MAAPKSLERVTVSQAVDAYGGVLALRVAMGALAASTRRSYGRDLAEFVRLVGGDRVLDDVEAEDVEVALVRIAQLPDARFSRAVKTGPAGEAVPGRGLHARARWLAAVRGLFRWAAEEGFVRVDPMPRVTRVAVPRRAKGARLGLSVDEARALRGAPAAAAAAAGVGVRRDQRLALRDELVLRLLMESGPRVAELCAANVDDVRVHEVSGSPVWRIRRGKGGRARDVPLSEAVVALLERYRCEERPDPPVGDDVRAREDAARALVVTVRGRRMAPRDVQRMVRRQVLRLPEGLRRDVTPHGLRHTAATVLLRHAGADVGTVADILGHADVATTSVYLDASAQAAARALAASPLVEEGG